MDRRGRSLHETRMEEVFKQANSREPQATEAQRGTFGCIISWRVSNQKWHRGEASVKRSYDICVICMCPQFRSVGIVLYKSL